MEQDSDIISFGLDSPQEVPGQLLVKLSDVGQVSLTASIPSGPLRRLAVPPPSHFGITALDRIINDYGVRSITRLHTPVSERALGLSEVRTAALAIASTYQIQLDEAADLSEAAERLQTADEVIEVSPNYYRWSFATPNDPMFGVQWGLAKIKCPDAWNRTKGNASVVVAVVDTGVDLDHPDLQANLLLPGRDFVDLVGVPPQPGWHFEGDFLTVDNSPDDEVGHGTHVAGTIAAVSNNAAGVAGVTWFCRILPVKVLARMVNNANPAIVKGVGTSANIAAGIRWAADNGAHIINLSLGGPNNTFVESDAVAYAQAKGCLLVAAMGNEASSAPAYPAAFAGVVAVGAVTQAETRAAFSNTGPHIDVVAPGVGIQSTDWDNAYSSKNGTSMAAPHVAGVAALVRSCNPGLTAAQIATILRDTAKTLKDAPADPDPNNRYGHGLIDAKAALASACPGTGTLKVVDDGGGKLKVLDDGITLKFTDDGGGKLKVLDDPITLKFIDDGGKPKVVDDPITLKFIDDVKVPRLDDPRAKRPGLDLLKPGGSDRIDPGIQPGRPAPFILATPHHSTAFAGSAGEDPASALAELQQAVAQQEEMLLEMQQAFDAGTMTIAEYREFQALHASYLHHVAVYRQLAAGGVF